MYIKLQTENGGWRIVEISDVVIFDVRVVNEPVGDEQIDNLVFYEIHLPATPDDPGSYSTRPTEVDSCEISLRKWPRDKVCTEAKVAKLTLSNGSKHSVAFDGDCWLLNERGQTIDRFHG
jgi:hypothetical protein